MQTIEMSTPSTTIVTNYASTTNSTEAPPQDIWKQIQDFILEKHSILIQVGIGVGGFLLGIMFMIIVNRCKKEEKEDTSRSMNGAVTNGRSPEEMDNIIRQYISDSNTMKNQWKTQEQVSENNAHQPLAYHPDEDMADQYRHDMHLGQNMYIDPVSNPTATEYTNSGVVQDYRSDDMLSEHVVSGYGENYFVESTENGDHYNSELHNDSVGNHFDQYGAPAGVNHGDNYFLLQKDFVSGMDSVGYPEGYPDVYPDGYPDEVTEL